VATDTVTAGYLTIVLYDEFANALTAVGNPEVRVQLDINIEVRPARQCLLRHHPRSSPRFLS
jgi:hypothetical protein